MNLFKRGALIVIGILLIAFAMSESIQASSVDPIDQTSDTANTIPNSHGGSKGVGQSFTAGKTGWMYDAEAFIWNSSGTEREISLTIHEGQDINGTVLGVAKVSSSIVPNYPGGWIQFTFNDGIYMESNKQYTMMMDTTNNDPNQVLQVTWGIYQPSSYAGGTAYYSGIWSHSNYDFAFRTYVASQQRDYSTSLQMDQLTTTYGNTEEIRATLLDAQNQAVSNKTVTFSLDGAVLGSSNTNGNGEAVFSYSVNTAIGNHTLTAEFAGDPTHLTSSESVMMRVDKRPLTVTANDATREYGTSNPVFTGTATGALTSDGITATYATSADQASNVGNYAIEATLVDPNNKLGNYEVTKTAGSLSVTKASLTVTANDATREYGTSNPVLTGAITGALTSNGITATYATSAAQASNVGSYAIEAALVDPNNKLGNYEVTKTAGSLSVTKASLTVTANDATREYGTSNPVLTGAITGALTSDGITATYATSADQASNVGNYAIEATLVDPNNKLGNYEVTKTAGSLSVTKASLTVTANDATREYGTSNPVLTGAITGALSSDGITATYATSADQASDVGSYAIEAALVDPNNKLGNYEVSKTAGSLSITKAQLTVTPHTISRWVNNANPFLDGVVTGVLNNDNISVKYATLAEQSSPIGSYTIEAEIIDPNQRLGNYEVTSNNARLTVYDVPKLTYATNDTASSVIGPLGLPATDDEGRSIQWASSNNQFVDGATGHVQRPSYTEGNKNVTLKATITADGATYEAIYPLIIIANSNTSTGGAIIGNSNTSTGVAYYIEAVSANGKQRVELKLDDLKKGFVAIQSDSEVAEFIISKATLTQLKAIAPSMKLQFITKKDEITIPIQVLVIAGNNHDLNIKIGRADTKTEFVEINKSLGANVWAGPVVFNVNGLDDQGRSSEISAFTAYVERKIKLDAPDSDFATVVLWDEEKQAFTFVPAQFVKENGKVTAIVKSMRNGYFFVIDRRVSFVDLQNHWAKSDIELLAAKFIVQGRNDMNFDPNGMLTRAETAALLVRAIGIPLNNNEFSFADVDRKWYEADVIAAEQAGLIKGYSDGTFRPDNRVTREELAVMLTRAIAYANPSLQTANRELALADVETISPWAVDSIQQALSLDIIKGDQQGNFKPQAEATRAEMVTLLSRMLKRLSFI
ncbi:hypothetical protein BBD42_07380 [Paenibacillus sp. BIHB 4019]|uniref:SLH domain-containing protein n=2 Tax=Paenibacillus sp. BIHB 4019 TaxID=1870819 RepID=A0A1B2DF30_9BACL|nr:hypothetical protein BBD42_07380 [Paenibacillus sp. BIHB 4019]